MSASGLSVSGVADLRDRLQEHVESGSLPGAVALVGRGDEVHVEVVGRQSLGGAPMRRDSIFRIASLTKPIAALGALILVDDGVVRLDDPVDDVLPELADRRVLRRVDSPLDDTVAAVRPITLRHLLSFQMGFGAVMVAPGTYPIQEAEEALGLRTLGPPWPPPPFGPDEWIRRFATLPLLHQPGDGWMYNTGAQVLGILIERASGRSLEQFLGDRVFGPLGMTDTGFSVPVDRRDRFTTAYAPDPTSGALVVLDDARDSWWAEPPAMPNAAGWLVSTIDDLWAFVRVVLAGGVHRGEQIVSAERLAEMTTDQTSPEQRASAALFLGDDGGWGLGLRVPAGGRRAESTADGIGWDGGTGTAWRSDPARGTTAILLTQRAMTSPEPPEVFDAFWRAVEPAVSG